MEYITTLLAKSLRLYVCVCVSVCVFVCVFGYFRHAFVHNFPITINKFERCQLPKKNNWEIITLSVSLFYRPYLNCQFWAIIYSYTLITI